MVHLKKCVGAGGKPWIFNIQSINDPRSDKMEQIITKFLNLRSAYKIDSEDQA